MYPQVNDEVSLNNNAEEYHEMNANLYVLADQVMRELGLDRDGETTIIDTTYDAGDTESGPLLMGGEYASVPVHGGKTLLVASTGEWSLEVDYDDFWPVAHGTIGGGR